MAPKESKKSRTTRPDDPDKDPWTSTQVSAAYSGHADVAAKKGVKPASRERWMAVKGLVEAEVVTDANNRDRQRYRAVDRRCECEDCRPPAHQRQADEV